MGNDEHLPESLHGNSLRGVVSGILQSNVVPKNTVNTVIIAIPFLVVGSKRFRHKPSVHHTKRKETDM